MPCLAVNRYERWWFRYWLRRRQRTMELSRPHRLTRLDRIIGWPIYLTVWILANTPNSQRVQAGNSRTLPDTMNP